MRRIVFILFVVSAVIYGCAPPTTTVRSVDTRPSISVSRASETSILYVDGIRIGKAIDYESPNQLMLDAGTHKVTIVESGRTVFEQTIFIESENKTIVVR